MVMTTISYSALIAAIGKEVSLEELRVALFDLGMELKSREDDDLAIEIKAERLDLLSLQGLARALKSFLGLSPSYPQYAVHQSDYVVKISDSVKAVRPYTVCAIIKNLVVTDEILKEVINVQEKLHVTLARGRVRGAIGIYPLENITLPILYTAAKPQDIRFVPLGESQEMHGLQILQQTETGKAYAHLLEGKDVFPYFVDATGEVLSMPPIINSEKTGRVTENTRDLFIECSGFEKKLLHELLTNLVTMFADMGGDIYSMRLVYEDGSVEQTPNLLPLQRTFRFSSFKKLIGIELSQEDIKSLLIKMMFEVVSIDGDVWSVRAPAFRADLWHEVDILDDIARAYGYNNLPLTLPNVASIASELPLSRLREDLSEVMVGFGFLETYTFALTSIQDQLTNMLINQEQLSFVPISNGNETQNMLRVSLIPEQLKALANNRNRSLPQKIFEGAYVVLSDDSSDVKSTNMMHLTALITDKIANFTQIRQILDALVLSCGKYVDVIPMSHPSFMEGRTGQVLLDGVPIGIIGELHPQVLVNFGLQTPVAAFEIKLKYLLD